MLSKVIKIKQVICGKWARRNEYKIPFTTWETMICSRGIVKEYVKEELAQSHSLWQELWFYSWDVTYRKDEVTATCVDKFTK